jgi:hypothetical protein
MRDERLISEINATDWLSFFFFPSSFLPGIDLLADYQK